jgi:peptidyl-prolyl cis-trans isomerase SurA
MTRFFVLAATILTGFTVFAQPASAGKEGIAVIVNQDVVTISDVKDRLKLVAVSSGLPETPEILSKLKLQIVDMLIEEQVRSQEARRMEIKVSQEEITQAFAQIAEQNNIPEDQFRQMLTSRGIKLGTLNDQIRAQLMWNKVVQRKLRPQVDISDADIDSELEKLRGNIGKEQYQVAEIFLPVNDPKKEADAKAFAGKIVAQLKAHPELFSKIARQFSQAPGADQGGSLGWVSQGQLPEEIEREVQTMQVNGISQPIKTLSGYHIVSLQNKRSITEDILPSREDILQRLGNARLDLLQRRYMMDLRSSAFVEKRD